MSVLTKLLLFMVAVVAYLMWVRWQDGMFKDQVPDHQHPRLGGVVVLTAKPARSGLGSLQRDARLALAQERGDVVGPGANR